MADPDAPAWMIDDDVPDFSQATADDDEVVEESPSSGAAAQPVEAPKPPAEWRKTYKLAVSRIIRITIVDA